MKKLILLSLAVLLAFFLVACSASSSEESQDKEKENAESQDSTKDEDNKKEEAKAPEEEIEEEAEKEKPEPQEPYKPLEPAEGAQSIQDSWPEENLTNMPEAQAYGDETERMVPAGETLVKDGEDLTDGPLKNHRLVAYYGHPNSSNIGILGEMEPDAFMEKLKEQTQAYSDADPDRPAIPMIELITTVAQRSPATDGKYYHMTPPKKIDEYAKLAEEHGALLMLDVQLGTDSVLHQVQLIEKWLKLPHVHLAIDTEFSVQEGEIPGTVLGQVNGSEVQEAVDYLTDMVEEHDLPDKIVLVHQFMDEALTNKEAIQPTENVEVVLNFDGWGHSAAKISNYQRFVRNETSQYGGFKIFYKKDEPILTPEEVIALDPSPAVVNYQ
ncbi:hypothetical protein [Planomicrobium sp. Y74]|uniref:hypothetical protein n=1 Tax=Planomicrobium sp. Y74 TaxID=2478977 RepID=UPI000EF4F53F|nr:hypothetical protein [Planomicrobium sp. Y74]RLQ90225.1 hypothetical protein D9754_10865 [Planomicrobium sp. Y74]